MILSMLSKSLGEGRAVVRGAVAVGMILLWLALAGAGGVSVGKLSEVQENDAGAFLPQSAESTRAGELEQQFLASSAILAIVVVEADGPLSPAQLAVVQEFADGVADLPLAGGTVGEMLTASPTVIPSERAALVTVPIDEAAADEVIDEEPVVALVVAELRQAAAGLAEVGLAAWVTGPAGAITDLVDAFAGIDGLLLLVALSVVFAILVLVYRSPSLPLTVLLTAVSALAAAALVVYALASSGVLVLNGQSQGILFILVVGAATDYSLLIVARYREELRRVESPSSAMARALRASLPPIAASAGTVIAGLLCLLLSDLASNASLGPVAAIGIVAAFVAALTFLPALLLVGGRHARFVFWPRIPRPSADATRTSTWDRVAALVGRRARAVWVVTALVLLAGAAWVPTLRASGTDQDDVFLTEVESVVGGEVLAEHFTAGEVSPITVFVPQQDAERVLALLPGVAGVERAQVFAPAPDAPPVVVDGMVRVDAVTTVASDSQEATTVVQRVRDAVHEASPEALVGGSAAERLDTQLTSARDLRVIVPAVLAVILLVLIGLLRAVVAPLLIIAANLLSFGATLGVAALLFNHVFDFPGADPAVPLYAFVFLVALGIDYSIFLMSRVREESLRHGTRPGVRRGLAVTGGVITSAGVVLAATFGALAVLPLLFLAQIAFLVGFGVLVDTLVVRSLLVPGLVHDAGRASWWPWQRRIPAVESAGPAPSGAAIGG